MVKFGSIYASCPTRFEHGAGAVVRRLIEGTGQRWTAAASEVQATPTSRAWSSIETNDEGFEDRASWSPREWEHQLQRWRRKKRETRLAEMDAVKQPNVLVQVRQPDKMQLTN